VLGSSVVRATSDRVRVLVFVDQTTVATNKKNPQVALNRVEFTMVERGGSWHVDDINSY
jgi:septum formation inhibitor-activating ATPase MinD